MTLLERQLAASVLEVQRRKHDDIDEWLDATPVPPKRLRRKKMANGESTAIVVHRDVSGPLEFTPEQRAMIRDTYANGASEKEFQVLLEVARVRRLNPLLRQIHFVQRWNPDLGRMVWVPQVSIDGMRAVAERTGKYDGQDEPIYEREGGKLVSATVKVYRKDWSRPAVGKAYWNEYVQKKKDGSPTRAWREMPHIMLAKCAEALAIRKAFPEDAGGLYTDEEMQQADNGHHGQRLENSPTAMPGDDESPRENEDFEKVMKLLVATEETLQKANPVTYDMLVTIRSVIGGRDKPPTSMTQTMSELNQSDAISPGQKKELGKLWNRIDRQVKRYEAIVSAPGPESSFEDEDEREPGQEG